MTAADSQAATTAGSAAVTTMAGSVTGAITNTTA